MSPLVVLVPVLARPHRVRPLLDSIAEATPEARVLFLADPGDEAECAEIRRRRRETPLQVDAIACGGNYAAKINRGVRDSHEDRIFLGADDLEFVPGWFERAVERMAEGLAWVLGVNDLIDRPHRPEHATHFLITREYAELETIDGGRGPLCEAYHHWGCDDELIGTATKRGVYAYAADVHVRHVDHPMTGGADDDTYRRGRSKAREDLRLLKARRVLWTS